MKNFFFIPKDSTPGRANASVLRPKTTLYSSADESHLVETATPSAAKLITSQKVFMKHIECIEEYNTSTKHVNSFVPYTRT